MVRRCLSAHWFSRLSQNHFKYQRNFEHPGDGTQQTFEDSTHLVRRLFTHLVTATLTQPGLHLGIGKSLHDILREHLHTPFSGNT